MNTLASSMLPVTEEFVADEFKFGNFEGCIYTEKPTGVSDNMGQYLKNYWNKTYLKTSSKLFPNVSIFKI